MVVASAAPARRWLERNGSWIGGIKIIIINSLNNERKERTDGLKFLFGVAD